MIIMFGCFNFCAVELETFSWFKGWNAVDSSVLLDKVFIINKKNLKDLCSYFDVDFTMQDI